MLHVCAALTPLVLASIYLFGWRAFALVLVSLICGTVTEAGFTFREGKPVTSAVFVTSLIFALSLPPALPLWIAGVGIVFGVVFGKMAFGGIGRNIFNPAMVGRCFIYITFPIHMTNTWTEPFSGLTAGFTSWANDAVTHATPLLSIIKGTALDTSNIFLGLTSGSLGETSALLILLGAFYIILKKAAPWRIAAACMAGGLMGAFLFFPLTGIQSFLAPLHVVMTGSFLFGAAFVVTEPITGAKTNGGQWVYGLSIGFLIMVLRRYSNFSEGLMFAVLLLNAFVPLIDTAFKKSPQKTVPVSQETSS
ncbi:MAG: RnfABCDGE type electron transport complex subunit D [Nitrospira sp.]|nr:RnfABCDGE type electron transport complex subunit D [bacterium]MBL7048091.1 RnfABCDGE type electron transport complex subunit D [Nitrospira sp.]